MEYVQESPCHSAARALPAEYVSIKANLRERFKTFRRNDKKYRRNQEIQEQYSYQDSSSFHLRLSSHQLISVAVLISIRGYEYDIHEPPDTASAAGQKFQYAKSDISRVESIHSEISGEYG